MAKLSELIEKAEALHERGGCSWEEAVCQALFDVGLRPAPPPPKKTRGEEVAEKMIRLSPYKHELRIYFNPDSESSGGLYLNPEMQSAASARDLLREAVAAAIDAPRHY